MSVKIDRSKCGAEYSLCPKCKYENEYSEKCQSCTRVIDIGCDFHLCGIPVGTGITHLHKNFSPKQQDA